MVTLIFDAVSAQQVVRVPALDKLARVNVVAVDETINPTPVLRMR